MGGLFLEPGFDAFLAQDIALCPKGGIVLDLLAHHRVEDDGDLPRRCRRGGGRTRFGFHAAKIITHRRLIAMQCVSRQSEQRPSAILSSAGSSS